MLGDLFRSGFEIVDDHEDADAIVVNTCSFVEEAKTESLEVLGSCLITVHMAIFAHNVATALEYAQIDRQMFVMLTTHINLHYSIYACHFVFKG